MSRIWLEFVWLDMLYMELACLGLSGLIGLFENLQQFGKLFLDAELNIANSSIISLQFVYLHTKLNVCIMHFSKLALPV